ncbi:MAG: alpha/beta hydrolase [Patescibacteria group bacterium]
MKKQQVVVIHGGGSFVSIPRGSLIQKLQEKKVDINHLRRKVDWKFNLTDELGEMYDVLAPRMPNADQPLYKEWKAWFERILPTLDSELIVIGHSLGGLFLLKYFSEETSDKKIKGLFSVAAPYVSVSAPGEFEKTDFLLSENLENLNNIPHMFFYHSTDDAIVSVADVHVYAEKIPHARVQTFTDRGHFIGDNLPEIVPDIKSI